jgi:hypothetical protein
METTLINSLLQEELNCSICLHLFTDPRSLECGHTFCFSCLLACGTSFHCPLCRKLCNIKDLNLLPKNYHIKNIIEKLSAVQQAQLQLIRDEPDVSSSVPPIYPRIYDVDPVISSQPSIYPRGYPVEPSGSASMHYPQGLPIETDVPMIYNNEDMDELALHNSVMMSASAPPPDDSPMVLPPPSKMIRTETIRSPQYPGQPPVSLTISQPKKEEEKVKYIDFKISTTELLLQFKSWKNSLWFTPHGFETAIIKDISPVLVPYWVYSVDCIVSLRAKVYSEITDPISKEVLSEWKEISEQKFSHYDDVVALGVPFDVAHYGLILENSQFLKLSMFDEEGNQDNSGWFDYIKSFISTPTTNKPSQSILEYPTLPKDNWKTCFDRHSRKLIENVIEIEPATIFLKKKGYSVYKDLSITLMDA